MRIEIRKQREIVIAIDEPETSMHVSNCFKQFSRLEELADIYKKQVIVTTHWYGFLPIAQSGNMQIIQNEDGNVSISTFSLSNIMESRRSFPDVIDLKSMYDLATSIIMYMRFHKDYAWIICEGSDDKKYLESVLNSDEYMILPVGGCGNVVKLYNLLYSPLTEKNEDNSGKCLFLIDTDLKMKHVAKPYEHSATKAKDIILRRLQIENGEVRLFDPTIPNTYSQTEMEDCLDKEIYFEALKACIEQSGDDDLISIINCFHLNDEATTSVLKGDCSCIVPNSIEMLKEKSRIISFAEDSANKYAVARKYKELCQEKEEYPQHALKSVIENEWK